MSYAHYHDELSKLMQSHKDQILTSTEVKRLFTEAYPDLRSDFVQATDHCIDHTCKGACDCAQTNKAIFSYLKRNTFRVL